MSTKTAQARKAMKYNTVEGAFAVSSDHLSAPYLNLFALALGATPFQIGMLNAFPTLLGNLLQLPYAVLTERLGKGRAMILWGGGWLRMSWVLIAFVPFMVSESRQVWLVIFLATLRIAIGNLGTPAWTAIQAHIVPRPIRGKYYANRNVILSVAGLAATLIAGRLLGISFPYSYQTLFLCAAIVGALATLSFAQIPLETEHELFNTDERRVNIQSLMRIWKQSPSFSGYCQSALLWNFGVMISGPLVAVYFVRNLQGLPEQWAWVVAANIVAVIMSQRYWGRLADKYGQKNVMRVSGLGVALIPFLWLLIPHSLFAIGVNFLAGFTWGGYNLAAFNLILEVTPEEKRTRYIGVFNTLMGVSMAISQLIGGLIAQVFTIRFLFLLSFLFRLGALWLFNRKVENTKGEMPLKALFPTRRRSFGHRG